jgi:carboxypeptidase PM20D1
MPETNVDQRLVAEHLGQAIQIQTISHANLEANDRSAYQRVQAFVAMQRALQATYPRLHRTLHSEVVSDFSLLYTWTGSEPELPPFLMMAHMDVVPIEPGSESAWTLPPFSGVISDGFVWGRGALDYKCGVVGMMEAIEWLIRNGYKPRRTVYLAIGHDEELGGMCGARRVARLLESRGVRLESVLDEGGALVDGILPGVERPVALIGVAEKGYLSLELSVEVQGGHSAIPNAETAIG